jgi:leucyl-tRNA synthetase
VDEGANGGFFERSTRQAVQPQRIDPAEVEKQGDGFVLRNDASIRVESRAYKMSKSRGNVVNPDEIVRDYGADSLRLYEMFMGPLEASKPWSMASVNGVRNFLDRAWRMMIDDRAEALMLNASVQDVALTAEQLRVVHKTIKAVTEDFESLGFNTAIARLMEFVNAFTRQPVRPKWAMETFVLLLSPLAPHVAEELWSVLGHSATLAYEPWPTYDEALTRDASIEMPVQVNGKVRGKVVVAADASPHTVLTAARSDERVRTWLDGKRVVKEIVVPGKLVNFVVQ